MFYSAKSSAVRAARKSGLVEFVISETPMGWTFAAPKTEAKALSRKELAALAPAKSTIEKPVDFVWTFVRNNPDMPRKLVIEALVKQGLNINMVTTQYHRCKSGYQRFKGKANDGTANA